MKLQRFFSLAVFAVALMVTGASCVKEGPPGLTGEKGDNGADGVDANETCKECHNPTVVDQKVTEFKFSKHHYGEAAFDEGGNATCAPCHEGKEIPCVRACEKGAIVATWQKL